MSRRVPREQQPQDQLELPRAPSFDNTDAQPVHDWPISGAPEPEPERGVAEVLSFDSETDIPSADFAQKFGELVHQLAELTQQRDSLAQDLELSRGFERTHAETVSQLQEEMTKVRADAETLIKSELEIMSTHLDGVQGELAATSLAKGDLEYQVAQLRARLESITASKVYAFYPTKPHSKRIYVLAPTMGEAIAKFEAENPGAEHGNLSVAVDKFIL